MKELLILFLCAFFIAAFKGSMDEYEESGKQKIGCLFPSITIIIAVIIYLVWKHV